MKSILKDESGVAYLLLIGVGLTIIITGMSYSLISDFVDTMIVATSYAGTPLANQMDADSVEGGNMLLVVFKMILMPILLCIMYFALVMSQKPERSW